MIRKFSFLTILLAMLVLFVGWSMAQFGETPIIDMLPGDTYDGIDVGGGDDDDSSDDSDDSSDDDS